MWCYFALLIIVTLVNGIEEHETCRHRIDTCMRTNHVETFPTNTEEFQKTCSTLMRGLEKVCDENTKLYKDVAENLQCYLATQEGSASSCETFSEELIKPILKDIDDYRQYDCLSHAGRFACIFEKIGYECGETAEKAAEEVFISTSATQDFCQHEVAQDVKDLISISDAEEDVKQRINKYMDSLL